NLCVKFHNNKYLKIYYKDRTIKTLKFIVLLKKITAMKTIILLLSILLSVSYGCTKKENPLLVKTKQFDFKADENCINICSYVYLEVPIASGNSTISTNINKHVLNFFKNT